MTVVNMSTSSIIHIHQFIVPKINFAFYKFFGMFYLLFTKIHKKNFSPSHSVISHIPDLLMLMQILFKYYLFLSSWFSCHHFEPYWFFINFYSLGNLDTLKSSDEQLGPTNEYPLLHLIVNLFCSFNFVRVVNICGIAQVQQKSPIPSLRFLTGWFLMKLNFGDWFFLVLRFPLIFGKIGNQISLKNVKNFPVASIIHKY